jgi:hypothetical protein
MKTLAALVLGISATLLLNVSTGAEPFNQRGIDFISTVPSGSKAPREATDAVLQGFNERNQFFTTTEDRTSFPAPSETADTTLGGFNDRSF